jgi:hypothetical protein
MVIGNDKNKEKWTVSGNNASTLRFFGNIEPAIMNMRKILYVAIIFALPHFQVLGQSYGTTLGLRFGNNLDHRTMGLTAQHRIVKGLTIEGIVQSDFNNNTTVHALVEKHHRLISKRFNYYYGTGISLGTEESTHRIPATREIITTYGNATIGMDLIFGVEITLLKANISIDYKPNINLVGRNPWYSGQVGISARTVLIKGSTQNKKKRQKMRAKRRKNREPEPFFKKIIRNAKEVF